MILGMLVEMGDAVDTGGDGRIAVPVYAAVFLYNAKWPYNKIKMVNYNRP